MDDEELSHKGKRGDQGDDPSSDGEKPSAKMQRDISALKTAIAQLDEKDTNHKRKEREYWADQLRISKWMNGITAAGVAAALVTLCLLGLQIRISRLQLKLDQRAWLTVKIGEPTLTENQAITAPITILNTGKTVARNFEAFVFAAPIAATEANPSFAAIPAQGGGLVREALRTGVIAPNTPLTMPIIAITPNGMAPNVTASPVIFTAQIRDELKSEKTVLLFYGQATYRDIFGDTHWHHFCTGHGSLSTPASAACAAYNDTD